MSISQRLATTLGIALADEASAIEIRTLLNAAGGGQAITQQATIAKATVTATTGSLPTAGGSTTIANAATPTVSELLDYCTELKSKLDAVIDAIKAAGVTL